MTATNGGDKGEKRNAKKIVEVPRNDGGEFKARGGGL